MTRSQLSFFYPPRTHSTLIKLVQWVAPIVSHWHYKADIIISAESLERLRSLQHQRLILMPNHPTFHDPPLIFALSGRLGITFQYMGALELFRNGLGPWLQRFGVYSIRRGLADRTSVAHTLEILSSPDCKLVVFAEGGCSFQNDIVMPFRTGVIQMGFQVINRAYKQRQPLPDLYAVPLSLKYRYTQDMNPVIEQVLQKLEAALKVKSTGDHYQRLRSVAEQRLKTCEQEYGLTVTQTQDWDQRVANLKAFILSSCEQQLGLTAAPEALNEDTSKESDRDRAYRILDFLESVSLDPNSLSATEWTAAKISQAVKQVLNYVAIYDGYVAANPTPERFLDTLTRLERDILGIDQPRPKGHRQALFHVSEPINLKDWFSDYQRDRAGTVTALTQKIHHLVQQGVDQLQG
jgi:hypothetical protein